MVTNPLAPVAEPTAGAPDPGLFDGLMTPLQEPAPSMDLGGDIQEDIITEEPSPDIALPKDNMLSTDVSLESETGLTATPDPELTETQVAGPFTGILRRTLQGDAKTHTRIDDLIPEGSVAGQIDNKVIVREATQEEVDEFLTLTGKTRGVPSPTQAQKAAGIPTANFNLENIDGPDSLKQTIDKVSKIWGDAGKAAGRGKMTWAETQELADSMGVGEVVDRLMRGPGAFKLDTLAEDITASLQAIATSAMELNRLAKIAVTSTDQRDLLRFRQHLSFQAALEINMRGVSAETARALNAHRIPRGVGSDVEASAISDLMKEFGGDNSIRDMAQSYLRLETQAQRNRFSYSAWDKIKGAWFEVWINGLLSAPATQMANIFGNMVFSLIQIPERLTAGAIGGIRQAFGSKTERVYMQEAISDVAATFQGIGDGFRIAGEAWRTEAPVRDVASKIETPRRRMITGQNMLPDGSEMQQKWVDYLGATIRMPGRALMTADEFFKAVAYRKELNALALRRAQDMKRNGASVDDIASTMDDIFSGKHDDILQQAEEAAKYSTFTNEVTGVVGQAGAAMQGTLVGRMLLPFFKTPANIFTAAMERTPYGFLKAIRNAKDPVKRDALLARASLGSATMGYVAYESMQGKLTGTGPTNFDLRRQLEAAGWQKWSFVKVKEGVENPRKMRVGHMEILHPDDVDYISYARLEPVSMVLAMSVDVAERMRWPTATQEERQELIFSGIDVLFNYMKDQTYIRQFAQAAKIVSARSFTEANNMLSKTVQGWVGSAVPYSSLLASIERVIDPNMDSIIPDRNEPFGLRTVYAGIQRLDGRTPFTDTGGPLLRDRFAKPRLQKGANIQSVIFPPIIADLIGDDADAALADPVLSKVIEAGVPLSMVSKTIDGVKLTAREYDAYVKFAANPPDDISFYSALKEIMSDKNNWSDISQVDKQKEIRIEDGAYKREALFYMIEDERYQEEFSELREKVLKARAIIENVGRQIQ